MPRGTMLVNIPLRKNIIHGVPLRLNSHLRFFRRELLRELFSPRNRKKWVDNPLLNFSVHTIVDQIAGVNVPI